MKDMTRVTINGAISELKKFRYDLEKKTGEPQTQLKTVEVQLAQALQFETQS